MLCVSLLTVEHGNFAIALFNARNVTVCSHCYLSILAFIIVVVALVIAFVTLAVAFKI